MVGSLCGSLSGIPVQKAEAASRARKTTVKTLGLQKPVRSLAGSARAVLVIGLPGSSKPVRGVYLSRIGASPLVFTHGLKPTDIILSVNGSRTKDPAALDTALANLQGQEYTVHVARKKGSGLRLYKAPVGTKSSSRHGVIPVPKIPIGIPIPKKSFRPKEVDSLKKIEQAQPVENELAMQQAQPVAHAQPVDTVPFTAPATTPIEAPVKASVKDPGITNAASEPGLPPEKTRASSEITANELYMMELVNKERKKRGLGILKPSKALTKVARDHSQDMMKRRFFSHITPDGKNPADRVRAHGISYSYLAENIATENWQESEKELVQRAHRSLMQSKHHRENILRPGISSIGIGISPSHKGGINVTQLFSGNLIP